jgi:transposase
MIRSGVQVFVAVEPIDMRLGFERLAGIVRDRICYEPASGALFAFTGRRRETVKILFFDGTGMCLFYKRLDQGTLQWPEAPLPGALHVELEHATLEVLLDRIAVEPSGAPRRRTRRRVH